MVTGINQRQDVIENGGTLEIERCIHIRRRNHGYDPIMVRRTAGMTGRTTWD
jgi:hypothetical protein